MWTRGSRSLVCGRSHRIQRRRMRWMAAAAADSRQFRLASAKTMTQENTLIRSEPCPECGVDMLWTQNAWHAAGTSNAAYQCPNGHVIDPALTRQCPACGLHDT